MKTKTRKTLNLPFAEVEPKDLKAALVDKYGTLAHFCRLTQRDVYKLNNMLVERPVRGKHRESSAYLYQVFSDAKTVGNTLAEGYDLTPIGREKIRAALGSYPTITAFCAEYTAFSSVFVSRVIGGSTHKITTKVKELAKVLKVDLVAPQPVKRNGI